MQQPPVSYQVLFVIDHEQFRLGYIEPYSNYTVARLKRGRQWCT